MDNNRFAREYHREINYDQGELQAYLERNAALLTADQCDCFCSMVDRNEGGVLFLGAPGAPGETFFDQPYSGINHISEVKIALATASNRIAATLLNGGHTLHST